jgi:hypothetical protein
MIDWGFRDDLTLTSNSSRAHWSFGCFPLNDDPVVHLSLGASIRGQATVQVEAFHGHLSLGASIRGQGCRWNTVLLLYPLRALWGENVNSRVHGQLYFVLVHLKLLFEDSQDHRWFVQALSTHLCGSESQFQTHRVQGIRLRVCARWLKACSQLFTSRVSCSTVVTASRKLFASRVSCSTVVTVSRTTPMEARSPPFSQSEHTKISSLSDALLYSYRD